MPSGVRLQRRRIEHVADLDDPMLRHDAQQRHIADGAVRWIDDGIGVRVFRRRALVDEGEKFVLGGERPVGRNIGPDLVVAGERRPQIGGVFGPSFSSRP